MTTEPTTPTPAEPAVLDDYRDAADRLRPYLVDVPLRALVLGPTDRLVITAQGFTDLQVEELRELITAKGWDLNRVLFVGGPGVQIAAMATDPPTAGEPA